MSSRVIHYFLLFAVCVSVLTGCSGDQVDVSDIQSDVKIDRMEHDMKVMSENDNAIQLLRSRYGTFFDWYFKEVIQLKGTTDEEMLMELRSFVNDHDVMVINQKIDSVYTNLDFLKVQMDGFIRHYKYYFPNRVAPRIVTVNGIFNSPVFTSDSVLAIGLDMFLGADCEFYPSFAIPKFITERFTKDYILPVAVRIWYENNHEQGLAKKEFLSQMIAEGKKLYFTRMMCPELADTILFGYSSVQLKWCEDHESEGWSFFIENKILFNTDASLYSKYMSEAPHSSGFPKEAPARIGRWYGYLIVQKYMEKHREITLDQLTREQNAVQILQGSGYKPDR